MGAAPLLTILKNGETIRTYPIGKDKEELILGRGEGCVIRLEDRAISRQHAVFRRTAEGIQVEKKSEFAPLSVNGKSCSRAVVKEGDVISIGPYLIRLTGGVEPAPAAPSLPASQNVGAPPPEAVSEAVPASPESGAPEIPGFSPDSAQSSDPDDQAVSGSDPAGAPEGAQALAEGDQVGLGALSIGLNGTVPAAGSGSQDGPVDLGMMEIAESDAATRVAPLGKVAAKLTFKPGTANVEEFQFVTEEISIGRAKNCDIVLNDKKASRKNTIIRKAGINYIIKDLGSANGTYVNGVQVTEQELSGDDEVQVGDVTFRFVVTSADFENQAGSLISMDANDGQSASLPVPEISSLISTDEPGGEFAAVSAGNSRVSLLMNNPMGQIPGTGIPGQRQGTNGQGLGMAGITGVADIGGAKKGSLLEKFRAMPPRKQLVVGGLVLVLVYLLLDGDPGKKPTRSPQSRPSPVSADKNGVRTFERLKPDEQKFVETKHALAFDYYKNQEFDKSLYELSQLFTLVSDYKNALELKRYAEEGKKLKEAKEEEKQRKEEEARLKVRVAELTEEVRGYMQKKEYAKAREQFPQILEIDPDNLEISGWKKEIDEFEEAQKVKEMQRQTREQINQHAWGLYADAKAKFKAKRYREAIRVLNELGRIEVSDRRVAPARIALAKRCRAAIDAIRDPLLQEAKQLEDSGELAKAYQLYRKATKVDPDHKEGYDGMARLRAILHDRAKSLYTEAVLAESYSDFETAKKKFKECLDVAPVDDEYHGRAERKLARYMKKSEGGS